MEDGTSDVMIIKKNFSFKQKKNTGLNCYTNSNSEK